MSRIGNKPVVIPTGVDIDLKDGLLTVKKGNVQLQQKIHHKIDLEINKDANEIKVVRHDDHRDSRALHGLMRSLVHNMVVGVSEGFKKTLEINGIGYRANLQGTKLVLSLGLSHPVEIMQPEGITFEVPQENRIVVKGADKQLVGEVAAKIRARRLPDAYKGKGIKYDYEVLRLKEGKTGA